MAALPLTSPASKPSTGRVSCLQQQLSWGARGFERWGLSESLAAKLVRVTACWEKGRPQEGLHCGSASCKTPQKVVFSKGVPFVAGGGEAAGHAGHSVAWRC